MSNTGFWRIWSARTVAQERFGQLPHRTKFAAYITPGPKPVIDGKALGRICVRKRKLTRALERRSCFRRSKAPRCEHRIAVRYLQTSPTSIFPGRFLEATPVHIAA